MNYYFGNPCFKTTLLFSGVDLLESLWWRFIVTIISTCGPIFSVSKYVLSGIKSYTDITLFIPSKLITIAWKGTKNIIFPSRNKILQSHFLVVSSLCLNQVWSCIFQKCVRFWIGNGLYLVSSLSVCVACS